MSTDIQAVFVSATTTAVDYATRLRGVSWANNSAGAADLIFRDGTASDDVKFKCQLPTGGSSDLYITDDGVRFRSKIHITVPTSCAATLFVG
tara:strand:+ start:831 stop:1106 length:276 start_codon:yes stop_codon:yes gene_type:complete